MLLRFLKLVSKQCFINCSIMVNILVRDHDSSTVQQKTEKKKTSCVILCQNLVVFNVLTSILKEKSRKNQN